MADVKHAPLFQWSDEDLDLLGIARLFAQTIEYDIRRSQRDGDDEGANLKSLTLDRVLSAIAKVEGRS